MNHESVLEELYTEVAKTCSMYEIPINPSMDYLELWTKLAQVLDPETSRLLQLGLAEDIADRKGSVFEQMLEILQKEQGGLIGNQHFG
ncbi:hypothetical protein [Sediminibacillus albus]|uniref:Uncharacterized protein n=1 Tax=Sediminibacillus albus TaxID=407036 RepID=A0A1G8Y9M2_9BACI|nr:hypothetical protein [Sediminibacillus albus]SDJ99528.1 hypothetical protein SAMN05216243_1489 [Sediminibacillus albus]